MKRLREPSGAFSGGGNRSRGAAAYPSPDYSLRPARDRAPLLPEPTCGAKQARQILMPDAIAGHQGSRLLQPDSLLA